MEDLRRILFITADESLKDVLRFCFRGWGYECFFMALPPTDAKEVSKISPDCVVVDGGSDAKSLADVCDSLKSSFFTSAIPVITLISKRSLRKELLSLREGVDDYLAKPPDPLELRVRVEMAVKRSRHNLYANHLTGLAGGIFIEDFISKKIREGKGFAVGYVDIDNFKSFNDRYGYLKGDSVIMQAAYMLAMSVERMGGKGDFVGHIGGDDFLFVTAPNMYQVICKNFICMFDTVMPFHYSPADRKKGCIMVKNRKGRMDSFPIMTVTIALVITNDGADADSMIKLNERAAEVKNYLKKMPGSKFMADRRMTTKNDRLTLQLFRNDMVVAEKYRPLGQILLENGMIGESELDRSLRAHWRRGEMLGEVLMESSAVPEEKIKEALNLQSKFLGHAK